MLAQNRIWILMARVLSNEATEAEVQEFQQLLRENEDLQQKFSTVQEFWTPAQSPAANSPRKLESLLHKAKQKEKEASQAEVVRFKATRFKRYGWVAAASIFAIVLATFLIMPSKSPDLQTDFYAAGFTDSITTQNGNRSQLILPDGSRVWLNAGSRLFYQKSFSGDKREVQLIGEAYFDVVKMPMKPFIVHAEGVNIKVLGTVFNVKCYPADDKIETTLLHGAVSVTHKNDPDKKVILLKPNEKLSITKQFTIVGKHQPKDMFVIEKVDTTVQASHLPETAWVYNRLEFRNLEFKTLAEKMERWYNVKIIFSDRQVQNLRFIGSFENETIEQALQALQAVADFQYKIVNNEIHIQSSSK